MGEIFRTIMSYVLCFGLEINCTLVRHCNLRLKMVVSTKSFAMNCFWCSVFLSEKKSLLVCVGNSAQYRAGIP